MVLSNPPQGLYTLASKIVYEREEGKNDLAFLNGNPSKKTVVGLARLVSDNKGSIEKILEKTKLLDKVKKLPRYLAMVLIAELNWGHGRFLDSDQFHLNIIAPFQKELILPGNLRKPVKETVIEEHVSSTKEKVFATAGSSEEKKSSDRKKVPFIYKAAATVLSKTIASKGRDFKGHLYSSVDPRRNIKGIFSLLTKTIRHEQDLNQIFEKTQLLKKNRVSEPIARILIAELLWGKKSLPPPERCIPIKVILDNEAAIRSVPLAVNDDDIEEIIKPRYVRVNTILKTVTQVVDDFLGEGFNLLETPLSYTKFISAVDKLKPFDFLRDYHLPDVLVFNYKAVFHNHPLYIQGVLILQDKSSCFVPHILNPKENSVVLDLCSAPGLKASHIAALMDNKGKIYCIEMDYKRFCTLKDFLKKSRVTIAEPHNMDALKVSPSDYGSVDYIILDVPCTGSGMTSHFQYSASFGEDRMKKLQNLQQKLLKFAIRSFPSCKRIVYSTCSVCHEENEDVVLGVMSLAAHQGYTLIDPSSNFKEGLTDSNVLRHTLCFRHERDRTNGFFIAVFDRSEPKNEVDESDKLPDIKEEEQEEVRNVPLKRKQKSSGMAAVSKKKSKVVDVEVKEESEEEEVKEASLSVKKGKKLKTSKQKKGKKLKAPKQKEGKGKGSKTKKKAPV